MNGTDANKLHNLLAFMQTLSKDQLTTEQQQALSRIGDSTPMQITQPDFGAAAMRPDDGPFFNPFKGMATELEVRVLTLLLLLYFETKRPDERTVDKWMLDVASDGARIAELGEKWAPRNDGIWNSKGLIQSELEAALRVEILESGGFGEIETVSAILDYAISVSEIYAFVRRLTLAKDKSGKLYGPVRDSRGSCSSRQVSSIPSIEKLLGSERRPLRERRSSRTS